jgi:carbon-monoxide dehydrogenase medium subunit
MSLRLQYARPRNLDQTIGLLDGLSAGAMVIAGGQELMPHLNYGRIDPSVFVDIGGLKELQGITVTNDGVSIGALTVHRDLQTDPVITGALPLLAYAAKQVGGGRQVHNRGTIGGNIVAVHPLYDIIPALLVLGASVEIVDTQGLRTVLLSDLLADTSHQLGTHSILARVVVPQPPQSHGWAYEKLKISEGSYASANAAAMAVVDGSGQVQSIGLTIGAVTEQPIDLTAVMSGLIADGADFDAGITSACAAAISQPLSDQQGHGEYRAAMASVVARRAVSAAVKSAQ